jgi:hypothetical protein
MNHLMKLAETLRDIAEEGSNSEIEQALFLCAAFADRVCGEAEPVEDPQYQAATAECSHLPN